MLLKLLQKAGGTRLATYSIVHMENANILYVEGPRSMELEVEWREPTPTFTFAEVSRWQAPYHDEIIPREKQIEILQRLCKWLRGKNKDGIYVYGYGDMR